MVEDMDFLVNEEAEATFAHDEKCWNKEDDEPVGYTYKGKKNVFVKAVENITITLKKGVQKQMKKLQFKILNARKSKNGTDMDVELTRDTDRGIAVLKVFGPNTRKECTLMIDKAKKHEAKFVKMLAEVVIRPMLDAFISGEGWSNLFVKNCSKGFNCKICDKGFVSQKNLSNHIEKYHSGVQSKLILEESEADGSNITFEKECTKIEIDEVPIEK